MLNAHLLSCSTLKLLKAVLFFHYCVLFRPVLTVTAVVLDRHSLCLCVHDCESICEKTKQRSWVSRKALPQSAEAQSFSALLSTSCVFKSDIALTQSKHRKCQQLFTENFLQRWKTKYFLFVKQGTRMCRARDDQNMTSAYHHSLETL